MNEADQTPLIPTPVVRLTPRGVGGLLLFAVLVIVSIPPESRGAVPYLVALGAAFLLAPIVAAFQAWRLLDGFPIQLHVRPIPPRVPVGSAPVVEVTIHVPPVHSTPRLDLELGEVSRRPRVLHHRFLAPPPRHLIRIEGLGRRSPTGRSSVTLVLPVEAATRGRRVISPIRLWFRDPLGLFGVVVAVAHPVEFIVHPVYGTLPPEWDALLPTSHPSEGTGEFLDLRPYVEGDRLHLLDRNALARFDRLLVRRFEADIGSTVHLVLDDRIRAHRRSEFESMLSAVVGTVGRFGAAGHPVTVSTLTGSVLDTPVTTAEDPTFLSFLADIRPSEGPMNTPDTFVAPPGDSLHALMTTASGARSIPPRWTQEDRLVIVA